MFIHGRMAGATIMSTFMLERTAAVEQQHLKKINKLLNILYFQTLNDNEMKIRKTRTHTHTPLILKDVHR